MRTLIHALIQLGKSLNLETLAEGIEETDQLTQLQAEAREGGRAIFSAVPSPPTKSRSCSGRPTSSTLV